jgi:peptidoglycan-associated lipoprotein
MINPMKRAASRAGILVVMLAVLAAAACGSKEPPVVRAPDPPPAGRGAGPLPPSVTSTPSRPPEPPDPVREPVVVPAEPVRDPSVASASLDDLNKNSPLKPVFFLYDSSDISSDAQAVLQDNAATMQKNASWVVTIEGHCDERGTAEYNLALGERRAVGVRAYLIKLGIPAERLRTVSYGKEFPFDSGHDESAMAKNRRAHFVITSK